MAPRSPFMRHWFAVEAIPIYALIGVAVGGASWYLSRLARGPTIVWSKNNQEPWNSIKPDESTKFMNVNPKLEKSWSRDKL